MEDIYPCACGGGKVEGGRAKRAKQGEREREEEGGGGDGGSVCRRVLSHGGEQHAAVSRPGVANHSSSTRDTLFLSRRKIIIFFI